jgi:DNA-binding transcriptional LysR family regulator
MELRHLRYFVAAAEEEHFGRAARRLNITEQALSLQIRQLEHELGTPLFERLPRGVALSVVGDTFLADARRVLSAAEAAAERARRIGQGWEGVLRVGILNVEDGPVPWTTGDILGRLVATFARRRQSVDVRTVYGSSQDHAAALREGRADVAIVLSPPPDMAGLGSEVLAEIPLAGALLPAAHPLASKRPLRCRDLQALPLLMFPRSANPLLFDEIIRQLRERGLEPLIAGQHQPDVGVGVIAAGTGWIALDPTTGEAAAHIVGVTYRRWDDAAIPVALHLLWRESERSALVSSFLALARELRDMVVSREAVCCALLWCAQMVT